MRKILSRSVMLCVLSACALAYGYSNPIEGGTTEVVTNDWQVGVVVPLFIGSNTGDNSMIVTNGGRVGNRIGYIGSTISSSNNSALVTGAGSTWTSISELSVGRNGAGNTLTVAAGGRVDTGIGYVGNNSGNNSANVDGTGSLLNAPTLYVGHLGSDNGMTVSGGGRVESMNGTIGYWISSDSNTTTVQDSNSLWRSSSSINVGDYGSGNQLAIANGGRVESPVVNLGVQSISSSNTVTVTGPDSVLDSPELNIGGTATTAGGTGNLVEVQNGGTVATTALTIHSGNNFDLNNGGRLAVSTNFNASMGGFNFNAGGTLEVGGELTGMDSEIDDQRTLILNGFDAAWDKSDSNIYVGGNTSGNSMIATNGALVQSDYGYIGLMDCDNNAVLVSGGGSVWSNSSWLHVGYDGSGNTLEISDGGQVHSDYSWIGRNEDSSNNVAIVTGSGSVWSNKNNFSVGRAGSGNVLTVADGGRVYNKNGSLGLADGANNNSVRITGSGSLWSNSGSLGVGIRGSGNMLTVENGGQVYSSYGTIGRTDYDNNAVLVTGDGSVWSNSLGVYVGYEGSGNSLSISNGGLVVSHGVYAAYENTSDGNHIDVTGDGSALLNSGTLYLGRSGASNTLRVADGGKFENVGRAYIGFSESSSNNTAVVSDGGSVWNNSDNLYVGYAAKGNSLSITNGGRVENSDGVVGAVSVASGNSTAVSGQSSLWLNRGSLTVGQNGSDNLVMITDGGRVENRNGYIGYASGAANNSAVVNGSGSVWQNDEGLYLGGYYLGANWVDGGTGNSLTVSNGGWVLAGNVDTNNIPDIGLGGSLVVGDSGGSVEMVIANGSKVTNSWGYIGLSEGESGSVTVSGTGSVWENSSQLRVGHNGSGNTLRIENGGHVHSLWGSSIGYGEGSDSNSVVVSGEGSVFSSRLYLPSLIAIPITSTNFLPIVPPMPSFPVPIVGGGSIIQSGTIKLGSSGSGNVLTVGDGSFSSGSVTINGVLPTNNYVSVVSGGNITTLSTNSRLVVEGALPIYGATNTAIIGTSLPPLQVAPAMITLSSGELSIGRGGSDNSLLVEDGALVFSMNGIIGETSNAWNNAVAVTGTNSEWNIDGDLYLGGRTVQIFRSGSGYIGSNNIWSDGGQGNELYVGDGGLVSVGRDMQNRNYSTVSVDPGSQIMVASNYYQDASSVLRFGVVTNSAGTPTNALVSVGGTAEFEEGATLQYSYVDVLEFDRFYTNLIVEAKQLIVGVVTNANALDLAAINLDGSLVDLLLWEDDQDIWGLVGRRYLADSAGFAPGSMMARLAREIDDLSLLGNPIAGEHIYILNGMSSARQNAQLTQRYAQGAPSYRHSQTVLGGQKQVLGQSRNFQTAARSKAARPEGAAGPHKEEQKLRGWIRGYGSWGDHDGTESFSGFEQNVYGTIVGLDKAYGKWLLGVAGGYAQSDLVQDNNDTSDAQSGYGTLYASLGTVDWFGDMVLSYGRTHVESRSGTALGGAADYDADNVAIYFGGGKEITSSDNNGLVLTPEAALLAGYYGQESYNDGWMQVDAYDRWSIQSRLGAALAVQKQVGSAVLRPEFRAYWLHEFNADPDEIGYSLIGGAGRYAFGMQAPDEDILEIGVGVSSTFNDRLELALDFDAQHSDLYKALTVGGRIMYEF